ncbi:MAG: hypothetical protein FWC01_03900 [Treponema sp.]|nr:hypothetical protein [Treponema sp.]MCL2237308.1 hypothetical protein [Treponema sp.]
MKILKILSIFALVLLVAGCDVLIGPDGIAGNSGNLSKVQVNIGGNARTLLPNLDVGDDDENGFSKYEISAEPINGNSNSAPANVEIYGTDYYGEIVLPFGDWKITVTAFIKHEGVDYPVVSGTVTFAVNELLHSVNVPIIVPTQGGEGTIEYIINYPDDAEVSLKLVKWPIVQSGTPVIDDDAIESGETGTKNIASGIYFLTITAELDSKTIIKNQIVHIYDKRTTYVDYSFEPADFKNAMIKLSGNLNITVDTKAVKNISMYLNIRVNEGHRVDPISIPITISGNTWEIDIPPISKGQMDLFVRFYDENDNEYNKVHHIGTSAANNIPNVNVEFAITLITLSGYADFGDLDGIMNWANVDFITEEGNFITYTSVNLNTYFWTVTFESFKEPTNVWFEVYGNADFNNNLYAAYFNDNNYIEVYSSNIPNIVLSQRILLSGTATVTFNGVSPNANNFQGGWVNIGTYKEEENPSNPENPLVYINDAGAEYFSTNGSVWRAWISNEYDGELLYFTLDAWASGSGPGTGNGRVIAGNRTITGPVMTNIILSGNITN